MTPTAGSRSISSNMACLMASRNVTGPPLPLPPVVLPFVLPLAIAYSPLALPARALAKGLGRTSAGDFRQLLADGLDRSLRDKFFFVPRFFLRAGRIAKMNRRY